MKYSKPIPKSILSLDVGRKRIGLAGCDPLGITITRLPALQRSSFAEDLKILKYHCNARKVKGLVIGLPLDERGLKTIQSGFCKKYGTKIANELELPIAWVNEHSTTWEAGVINQLENDRTGRLDSASAELLLKQWLQEGPELKPIQIAVCKDLGPNLKARSTNS